MATWAEQGGPDLSEPIPPCPFLVKKGEEPDFATRGNIFPYRASLANLPNKFKPLLGEDGKPLKELPPIETHPTMKVSDAPRMIKSEPPVITDVPSASDMRQIQIMDVLGQLEPGDLNMNGNPRIEVVRERTGIPGLTTAEVRELWTRYQKENE